MRKFGALALAGALAALTSTSASAATIYANDFSVNAGAFTGSPVTQYGNFGAFLGILTQGTTASLALTGLGANAAVSLAFDLYTLRSLDGDTPGYDDYFRVKWNGATVFDHSFANFVGVTQSYGGAGSPAGAGSVAGVTSQWPTAIDYTYALVINGQADAAGNLTIQFIGASGQEVEDEGFGIDNVVVSDAVAPVPLPAGLPLLAAGIGGLALMRRRKKA